VSIFSFSNYDVLNLLVSKGINDRNPSFKDVYELDLKTTNRRLILQNDRYGEFYFDEDLQLRLLKKEGDQGDVSYHIFDSSVNLTNHQPSAEYPLYREADFDNAEFVTPIGFDSSGKLIFWLDNNNQDDFPSLYAEDFVSRKQSLIFRGNVSNPIIKVFVHPLTKNP